MNSPLPRWVIYTLDLLSEAKNFTTVHFTLGYWRVPIKSTPQEKTVFTTYSGLYKLQKMPFGVVNIPAAFQRLMEVVHSGVAQDRCHVYLHEGVRQRHEEHNTNLQNILDRIE